MANCAYTPTNGVLDRRRRPGTASVELSAPYSTPLTPTQRARAEILVERLIALLDHQDAPAADMEPDHDGEAEADEASLQSATLTPYAEHSPRPFPGWDVLDRAGISERVNASGRRCPTIVIEGVVS